MAANEFPEEIKTTATTYLHSHSTPASGDYVWHLNPLHSKEGWRPKIFSSYRASGDSSDDAYESTYEDIFTFSGNKMKVTANNVNWSKQAFVKWLADGGTLLYLTDKYDGTNRAVQPTFGDITTMVQTRCKIIAVDFTEKLEEVWTYNLTVARLNPV